MLQIETVVRLGGVGLTSQYPILQSLRKSYIETLRLLYKNAQSWQQYFSNNVKPPRRAATPREVIP